MNIWRVYGIERNGIERNGCAVDQISGGRISTEDTIGDRPYDSDTTQKTLSNKHSDIHSKK